MPEQEEELIMLQLERDIHELVQESEKARATLKKAEPD
jgi:hypothetical protein